MNTSARTLAFGTLALAGALVFFALAAWQVARLSEKEALIAGLNDSRDSLPLVLEGEELTASLWSDAPFREVSLRGSWRDALPLFAIFADQNPDPDAPTGSSYRIIVPLDTQSGVLLVDAGASSDLSQINPLVASGPHRVRGQIWPSEPAFPIKKTNSRVLFALNAKEAAARFGLQTPFPGFLRLDANASGLERLGPLKHSPGRIELINNHFSYAVTWLSLGLIWLFLCLLALMRRKKT